MQEARPALDGLSRLSALECLSLRQAFEPSLALPLHAMSDLKRLILRESAGVDFAALVRFHPPFCYFHNADGFPARARVCVCVWLFVVVILAAAVARMVL